MSDIPEKKKYKNNFLKKVIYKVNFDETNEISEDSIRKYKEALGSNYDPLSLIEQKGLIIQGKGSDFSTVPDNHSIWKIEAKDGTHFVEIDRSSFAIIFNDYDRFSSAYTHIETTFNQFFEQINSIKDIRRVGLRYVNEIEIKAADFTKWSDFIQECLTKHFDFYQDTSKLRRSMHSDVIAYDEDTSINLNYGIFNKYFPAPIVEPQFILDIDAYSTFAVKVQDCLGMLKKYNEAIAIYFERSITEGLREKMEVVNE